MSPQPVHDALMLCMPKSCICFELHSLSPFHVHDIPKTESGPKNERIESV